jgi:hypothetical protein
MPSNPDKPKAVDRINALMKAIGAMYGKKLSFEIQEWSFAASHAGVYFLLAGEEIVYVGKSVNVAGRVGSHSADKVFDRCLVMPVKKHLLEPMEAMLILCLYPKFNRQLFQPNELGLANQAKLLRRKLGYAPFDDDEFADSEASHPPSGV